MTQFTFVHKEDNVLEVITPIGKFKTKRRRHVDTYGNPVHLIKPLFTEQLPPVAGARRNNVMGHYTYQSYEMKMDFQRFYEHFVEGYDETQD